MKESLETLMEALKCYDLAVKNVNGNEVSLQNNYTVEIEANGLYKLFDDGYVVAPFTDLNELCRFIVQG